MDEAIDHANRKTPKHFMDVLLAKRYDDDDMIILHEGISYRKNPKPPMAAERGRDGRCSKDKKTTGGFISEADEYLFAQGTHYDIYKKLGGPPFRGERKEGNVFAVWAPHALQVHVFGTFNGWEETQYPMKKGAGRNL